MTFRFQANARRRLTVFLTNGLDPTLTNDDIVMRDECI
jgi:hypothetical protein